MFSGASENESEAQWSGRNRTSTSIRISRQGDQSSASICYILLLSTLINTLNRIIITLFIIHTTVYIFMYVNYFPTKAAVMLTIFNFLVIELGKQM